MWTEEKLNTLLTTPSDKLIADIVKIKGDIMVRGETLDTEDFVNLQKQIIEYGLKY